MVTDRLHGLVLALRTGVPALAVDPVEGGAKLTAQARACRWPAVLPAGRLDATEPDRWWTWCLAEGSTLSRRRRDEFAAVSFADRTGELLAALSAPSRPRWDPPTASGEVRRTALAFCRLSGPAPLSCRDTGLVVTITDRIGSPR